MHHSNVSVWEEKVIIPTYAIGKPDKNPMFFEKRVYQGSSGVVYPNPVIEKIADEKEDKEYTGLFLENKYLRIMILPELGGRIQMAYDKIKQRHFIYYNQVIKPALVGLTGPWISGGIEFNWPQHHRPSTFEPVDYKPEEHADGSKTVWVNEVERMFHTKGMAGFTLHPDKAFVEIKAKLFNRSALPQTFLWWANPAVKVNDHYQSIFPPDVNAVFDHGKRDVSDFPIATGTYYKVDYSPGTDISMYKNIPVPTSYMAINSDYDFVGGYEHDTEAGLLHVANHHVSPGKKQWTWGHGDFGQAWDRNLTDEDGPYIELMTGVFTDNQPDFSWLMPYEEKTFTQYFLPYRELGMVKNATKDILLALEKAGDILTIKIQVTSEQADLNIELSYKGEILFTESLAVVPENIFVKELAVSTNLNENELLLIITNSNNRELLRYEPVKNKQNDLPAPARPALEPAGVESVEELFLTGQHLEQYRHATYSPIPYYEEALRRQPTDIRNNNALGKLYLRKGRFAKAEPYLRKAVETSIQRNPNPYDSEPYYNLGLCLKYLGRADEAYTVFYKSTWSNAWKDTGFFSVAQIDMARGHYALAHDHITQSLDRNANNSKAYVVKAAAYRNLNQLDKALKTTGEALNRDGFNLGAIFEEVLAHKLAGHPELAAKCMDQLLTLSRNHDQNFIEYALDYAAAGLYNEAGELLQLAIKEEGTTPMVYYSLGYFSYKNGLKDDAVNWFEKAAKADPYLCFPNRLDEIGILQAAIETNSEDAKASYYLGVLFYDKRQYTEAISWWEKSAALGPAFPTVFRNLAIAYFNKQNNAEKALAYFETAFSLDPSDARVLMELDQLYKRLNRAPEQRLKFIEDNLEIADQRDDVYLERATLYNLLGKYAIALNMLNSRKFHPWEGGEGKASGQYVFSLTQLAKKYLEEGNYDQAIANLNSAKSYPHNLGEGKLYGTQENDIDFWLGCVYEAADRVDLAEKYFEQATVGLEEPSAAVFYNDQQPDKIFYQGLAWKKLGKKEQAISIFKKLVDYGAGHANDEVKIDYFAVSLPNLLIFDDDLNLRNSIHALFLQGLGLLGLQEFNAARKMFSQVLELDAAHAGSKVHLDMAEQSSNVTEQGI
jgi:tetratricopeptide (TPR) repeat protein